MLDLEKSSSAMFIFLILLSFTKNLVTKLEKDPVCILHCVCYDAEWIAFVRVNT